MSLVGLDNLKNNINLGWVLLLIFLVGMAGIYLVAKPSMPLGTAMYGTILVLLVIGLFLEG